MSLWSVLINTPTYQVYQSCLIYMLALCRPDLHPYAAQFFAGLPFAIRRRTYLGILGILWRLPEFGGGRSTGEAQDGRVTGPS